MLDYYSLIDIGISIDEFLKRVLAFNIAKLEKHPKLGSGFDSFYSYLKGISDFGEMAFFQKKDLKIYAEKISKTCHSSPNMKFHAIDSTGLVYGHIIGPSLEIINPVGNIALAEKLLHPNDEFYGKGNAALIEDFDCVIKMNAKTYEESIPVNVELLRSKYLPLKKGYDLKEPRRYFDSSNKSNIYYYSSVIYRADDRSFYLPLYELLRGNPNLSKEDLTIKPNLKKEHISFDAEVYSHNLKYEWTKFWTGIISYEEFEIISLDFVSEKREYIG